MRLTILTRASDLARLQGHLVADRLRQTWPSAAITLTVRESAGDRDGETPLWQMGDKGAFTSDLSHALATGGADIVVHSWKDLPIEPRRDTVVAATLPREDARDVLIVRREAAGSRAPRLKVLSSSPRRALMLGEILPALLPWDVDAVAFADVRGNVPTRIRQLAGGQGDALVVAKAALDRLLDPASPFTEAARSIRTALDACDWMVLPLRDLPSAAAQGALALEVAASNTALAADLRSISDADTWRAVQKEREILAGHGGGCHQAIGASVMSLPFGVVTSVRGRTDAGSELSTWALDAYAPAQPTPAPGAIWPRPEERGGVTRRPLDVPDPLDGRALYVTRDEALPASWAVAPDRFVWAAGPSTWRKLAARGVWVHGSSEGLGTFDPRTIDRLAGRQVRWHRLTHTRADVPDAFATYESESAVPAVLRDRTHFFWRSASEFRRAIAAFPDVRDRWHACGPGHTLDVVERLAGAARVRPYLTYEDWLNGMTS